jgi:hypothetical protein
MYSMIANIRKVCSIKKNSVVRNSAIIEEVLFRLVHPAESVSYVVGLSAEPHTIPLLRPQTSQPHSSQKPQHAVFEAQAIRLEKQSSIINIHRLKAYSLHSVCVSTQLRAQ